MPQLIHNPVQNVRHCSACGSGRCFDKGRVNVQLSQATLNCNTAWKHQTACSQVEVVPCTIPHYYITTRSSCSQRCRGCMLAPSHQHLRVVSAKQAHPLMNTPGHLALKLHTCLPARPHLRVEVVLSSIGGRRRPPRHGQKAQLVEPLRTAVVVKIGQQAGVDVPRLLERPEHIERDLRASSSSNHRYTHARILGISSLETGCVHTCANRHWHVGVLRSVRSPSWVVMIACVTQ